MVIIVMALQWIEKNQLEKVILCLDSISARASETLRQCVSCHLQNRPVVSVFRLPPVETAVRLMWIPAPNKGN